MSRVTKAELMEKNRLLEVRIGTLNKENYILTCQLERLVKVVRNTYYEAARGEINAPTLCTFQRGFEAMSEAVGSLSRMLNKR